MIAISSVLLLSEVRSQAAPTACMKAPTSEAKSAMSRLRNKGMRSGRQGLAALGWTFWPSGIIRDFIPSWRLAPDSPFADGLDLRDGLARHRCVWRNATR